METISRTTIKICAGNESINFSSLFIDLESLRSTSATETSLIPSDSILPLFPFPTYFSLSVDQLDIFSREKDRESVDPRRSNGEMAVYRDK